MGRGSPVILLDTHAVLWFAEDHPRLGARTTRLTDRALYRDEVLVSAISFWEIAMLADKHRLILQLSPAALRRSVLEQGIRELVVDGAVGIAAAQLARFHGDPADRLIVASALTVDATLVTADRIILTWQGPLKCHDART
jgi:PIN domain nuclease of toxin-antitoxin system